MNNSTSETTTEEAMADIQPSETPSLESAAVETQPEVQSVEMQPAEVQHDFQPLDLRRRLRELLSVPERDRSDEVWDEIIELEIQLAPGNRIATNETQGGGRVSIRGGKASRNPRPILRLALRVPSRKSIGRGQKPTVVLAKGGNRQVGLVVAMRFDRA